ncbi:unnamed protein product [Rangifer tarandus platyrhynchus]|uniref:Uncharacterized protein n=1 Tax=Rangifer tarandus platyrhynchus TaxID=3082113 RepID=A0AC60A574_RANTA
MEPNVCVSGYEATAQHSGASLWYLAMPRELGRSYVHLSLLRRNRGIPPELRKNRSGSTERQNTERPWAQERCFSQACPPMWR